MFTSIHLSLFQCRQFVHMVMLVLMVVVMVVVILPVISRPFYVHNHLIDTRHCRGKWPIAMSIQFSVVRKLIECRLDYIKLQANRAQILDSGVRNTTQGSINLIGPDLDCMPKRWLMRFVQLLWNAKEFHKNVSGAQCFTVNGCIAFGALWFRHFSNEFSC
ncbi:hypothetical protein BLOT_014630 [Blomia tropicalis]|nr:hypothetical protein BLOT_014630 [Blomia tropicalis]